MHQIDALIHCLGVASQPIKIAKYSVDLCTHSFSPIFQSLVFSVAENGRRCIVLAVFSHRGGE